MSNSSRLTFTRKKLIFLPMSFLSSVSRYTITKRQKFVSGVLLLSLGLFFSEHILGKSGVFFTIFLALFSEGFLLWAIKKDIKDSFPLPVIILPFLYSLAFALFYFLTPARYITSVALTLLYAIGLYSLYLSQNIFIVASIRTIQLLSGARIVSFILSLISYFFLTDVVFSLHLGIVLTVLLVGIFSLLLVTHVIWIYALDKQLRQIWEWVLVLSVSLLEVALLLWFWPSTPTVLALFLTGYFYVFAGISHIWFEKRIYKNVIWEYVWVAVIIFGIFILSTTWKI